MKGISTLLGKPHVVTTMGAACSGFVVCCENETTVTDASTFALAEHSVLMKMLFSSNQRRTFVCKAIGKESHVTRC